MALAPGVERKNRVNQPEDGRETRGIQNEHNVGLRRTRAPAALKPEPKFKKSKINVTVGQFIVCCLLALLAPATVYN